MPRPIVLLTDSDLGDRMLEAGWLKDALGAEVIIADCRSADDVLEQVTAHMPDALVTQWAPIDSRVISAAAGRCRVISRIGIGTDMIDSAAANAAGIPILNVPFYCTEEVATHAVSMALALWRRLPQLDAEVRAGVWSAAAHANDIGRLSNATIGLVGGGRIGALVAKAFEVWGAEVLIVDPAPSTDAFERVSLEVLAERADIISLHAPLLQSTRHIVGQGFLDSLVRRPVIVNTSRGGLVDIDAAVAAVDSGQIRGLGLDVFESEPLAATHPVRAAKNTLLSPHAAWCSHEALPDLRRGAIDNVITVLSQTDESQAHG